MRTLLLSDIHANIAALESVLADAKGEFDAVWVLGDTIGYGADPSACLSAVRDLNAVVIAGNHEEAAVGKMTTKNFNPVAKEAIEWTAESLTEDERRYLEGLELIEVRGEFTLAHGSPRDPVWEYIESGPQIIDNLEHFETKGCVVGHTHIPFTVGVTNGESEQPDYVPGERIKLVGERLYINPGSVGQPRDRDPRASYVLLDLDAWDVEFRRAEYDISRTQARIQEEGLPRFLGDRLFNGQ